MKGEGEGREGTHPSIFFFCSRSNFRAIPRLETLASQATRITDHSATLIDNIFLNSFEHFTISGNIVNDLSDHLPNFLISNKFSSLPCNVKIFKEITPNLISRP